MCGYVGLVEIVFSFVVIVGDKGYDAIHFIFVCNNMEIGAQCPPLWVFFGHKKKKGVSYPPHFP
jgi:hypothetical protein